MLQNYKPRLTSYIPNLLSYLFLLYFVVTNLDSHQVQLLALVGGDGAFLVVVFPRSQQQQSPFCAGIKLLALWFC